MSGDLLLASSLALRAVEAALGLALAGDTDAVERLRTLTSAGQERRLRIECTEPIAAEVAVIALLLRDGAVRLVLADPQPADATIRGSRTGLLSLRHGSSALVDSSADTLCCDGDRDFAAGVIDALVALRPDPLLPLVEAIGPRVPSMLHTARSVAGEFARSLFGTTRGDKPRAD